MNFKQVLKKIYVKNESKSYKMVIVINVIVVENICPH
jgi:hypothetical protein